MALTVGAIVVDHDVGPLLTRCLCSLLDDGVARVVVVENGADGSVERALRDAPADLARAGQVVRPGRNLGYGAGVNRGLAVLAGETPAPDMVLVSNPDVIVHPGAVGGLRTALEQHPSWAVLGPRIFTDAGDVYPSVRSFPELRRRRRPRPLGPVQAGQPLHPALQPRHARRVTSSCRRTGSRARASWPGGRPWRSWGASTRPISCTTRTWTCAGGPTRPAGASDSPGRLPSPTSRG